MDQRNVWPRGGSVALWLRACWVTHARGWMSGGAGQVHSPVAVLDEEQDVQAAQEHCADVEAPGLVGRVLYCLDKCPDRGGSLLIGKPRVGEIPQAVASTD